MKKHISFKNKDSILPSFLMKNLIKLFFGLCFCTLSARTITVNNASEISAAIKASGDTLVMNNGNWTSQDIIFEGVGTQAKPIVLRAKTPGLVILTSNSSLQIGGSYLVVDGLNFKNCTATAAKGHLVQFRTSARGNATYCRLTNCKFESNNPTDLSIDYKWVSLYGTNNRVDNCYFMDKKHLGTVLVVWFSSSNPVSAYHSIDHNYFTRPLLSPTLGNNGAECIRIGDSNTSLTNSYTTVEYNYFDGANGEIEVVSNKSCYNTFRYNTFNNCAAILTIRHGHYCTVEGNYFYAPGNSLAGGVRIIGVGHKVINNYFERVDGTDDLRAPIVLMGGVQGLTVNSVTNRYVAAENVIVAYNTLVNCKQGIVIGNDLTKSGETYKAPLNCTIDNNIILNSGNTNSLDFLFGEIASFKYNGNIFFGKPLGKSSTTGFTNIDPKVSASTQFVPAKLLASSPAINATVGSYNITEDFDGQLRNDGILDIGCDEFSNTPILRTPIQLSDVGPCWMRNNCNILPCNITATISTTTPTTFCQGGSVVLTASAGSSYIWRNGNTILATTTQTHTANAAGAYTVEVTNANGCKATSIATTVTVNPLPIATISTTTPITFCQGGSVVLTASAGTSYIWRNGNTTLSTTAQTHTANAAGAYTVEVTNANGCKATSAATTVTVNPLPTATISTTTPTTFCAGGSVVLTASAGSSYIWRNGNTTLSTTTQTLTATAAGSYTVEVTNANGCKATSAATTVTVNPLPTATISTTTSTTFCQGGSVVLTASAGSSYIWRNGNTVLATTTQTHTANAAGTYTVEVTNANGCKATSAATTVTVNPLPTATISTTTPTTFCQGGSVVLTASAGTSYVWRNGNTTLSTATQTLTATGAGSYTVEVTNANGCKATSTATPVEVQIPTTWYADADNDGLGDINTTKVECTQPVGYVSVAGDNCPSTSNPSQTNTDGDAQGDACDTDDDNDGIADANDCAPLDKNIGVATTWYADADNDGLGDFNTTKTECTQPVGYVATSGDNCPNDMNKTNPGNCGCGNTENSCLDCFGTPNGTAFLDDCKICVGGLTQKEACIKDCHGDFGGTAFVDSCGKCAGGNTGLVAVTQKDMCITSVEETIEQGFEVSPNPFTSQLSIKLNGAIEYKLYDAYGKLILSGKQSINIETSQFAAGVYYLFANGKKPIKMVKN